MTDNNINNNSKTTGASPDEAIVIAHNDDDDDDGDDDDDDEIPLATMMMMTATSDNMKQPSVVTAISPSSSRKRPFEKSNKDGEQQPNNRTDNDNDNQVNGNTKNKNKNDEDGCMLNPRNPIKIFATDRDKIVRRRLRRSLKSSNYSNSNSNSNSNNNYNYNYNNNEEDDRCRYRRHWSMAHCWTFREMLGFDRFSSLRRQEDVCSAVCSSVVSNINNNNNNKCSSSNNNNAIVIKNATGNVVGIDWMFIATYILDVDFLLNELPELVDVPTVVVVYQYKDNKDDSLKERAWAEEAFRKEGHSLIFLLRNPRAEPNTNINPLRASLQYGCHHTKMVLTGYSSGRLRVNIHTSNLRREDVHDKCQGAFLQDFKPKSEDQLASFVAASEFEESLVTYLESYHFVTPLVWNSSTNSTTNNNNNTATTLVSHLQTYDFSTAVGVLIPSIPGYHKPTTTTTTTVGNGNGNGGEVYGYLKVRQAIREHCGKGAGGGGGSGGPIVCQFSSMGSLSEKYLDKVADAWNVDADTDADAAVVTTNKNKNKKKKYKNKKGELSSSSSSSSSSSLSLLRIVWPTVEEIETSVEGRAGGGSVPGRSTNLHKKFVRPLLHKWKSLSSSSSSSSSNSTNNAGSSCVSAGSSSSSSSSSSSNNVDGGDPLDKGKHVPHIKSYYQIIDNNNNDGDEIDDDDYSMRWFVLSSHNLSKAAWGEIQYREDRGKEVLTIQHWELGVFVSPSTLGVDAMGPLLLTSCTSLTTSKTTANSNSNRNTTPTTPTNTNSEYEKRAIIPLPYKFRPDKYEDSDQPWVVE